MTSSGLAVGQQAPQFALQNQQGQEVSLSSFQGKKAVALVFFPFAFSGICTGELCEIRDNLGAFDSPQVQVLAISCDPGFSLRAWAHQEGYFFPLLSDFWPHGEVAKQYQVFDTAAGMSIRGTFLIDRSGQIAWTMINSAGQARDFSGFHAALAALPH